VKFLVDDPIIGSHPLHIARADFSSGAGGITMLQLALIHDRNSLESFVWMSANTAHFTTGRELMRCGVIE
jgi:hypothetical protein